MIVARVFLSGVLVAGLVACSGGKSQGPDEFSIIPNKPLETPEDLSFLPEPAPGARNRVDRLPLHDAVAALGGSSSLLDSTNINGSEQPLLNTASRYGVTLDVRKVAAQEDAEHRRGAGPRLLERLAGRQMLERTYRRSILDREAEAARLDASGVNRPKPKTE